MALEHSPHEQPSDTEPWRRSDFASLEILERWLATEGLNVLHNESEARGVGTYLHQGYKALSCSVCHRPTIAGIVSADATCGRQTCDTAVSGAVS